ncbi:hypothetical protein O9929_07320 [Vibrio lentus]|nr:hypothetical protein [Vibrio lentus]
MAKVSYTSLHGTTRMASNSLLECGIRMGSGEDIVENIDQSQL